MRILTIRLVYSHDYNVWFWYDLGGYWPRGFHQSKAKAWLLAIQNKPWQGPTPLEAPLPPLTRYPEV